MIGPRVLYLQEWLDFYGTSVGKYTPIDPMGIGSSNQKPQQTNAALNKT